MHQRIDYEWDNIWHEDFDRNGDGILSENELRTVITTMHGAPYEPKAYSHERAHWRLCACILDQCGIRNDSLVNATMNNSTNVTLPKTNSTNATVLSNITNATISSSNTTNATLSSNITNGTLSNITNATLSPIAPNIVNSNSTATHSSSRTNSRSSPTMFQHSDGFPSSSSSSNASEPLSALALLQLEVAEGRTLTKELIRECPMYHKVENYYKKKLKNKFEIEDTQDVAFVMIGTNATDVRRALDGIRSRRHKFVCLNDNMNHSNPHSEEVVKVLHDFYESLFPFPSQFELPADQVNRFLYVEELHEARDRIGKKKRSIYAVLSVLGLLVLGLLRSVWVRNTQHNGARDRQDAQDTHTHDD
jgi:hypothetical protein